MYNVFFMSVFSCYISILVSANFSFVHFVSSVYYFSLNLKLKVTIPQQLKPTQFVFTVPVIDLTSS